MKLVIFHQYFDGCESWEGYIPFEAESVEAAEYALLEVHEFNSKLNWRDTIKRKTFCGLDVYDDEDHSYRIMTLDYWFENNNSRMLEDAETMLRRKWNNEV